MARDDLGPAGKRFRLVTVDTTGSTERARRVIEQKFGVGRIDAVLGDELRIREDIQYLNRCAVEGDPSTHCPATGKGSVSATLRVRSVMGRAARKGMQAMECYSTCNFDPPESGDRRASTPIM
jgi:hypothetical protein